VGVRSSRPRSPRSKRFAEALGLMAMSTPAFQEEVKRKRLPLLGLDAAQIDAMVEARADARRAKDWARADELRGELEARKIAVMDRADGSDWRLRL
jgi:cysteinyl-tRNA synthetase